MFGVGKGACPLLKRGAFACTVITEHVMSMGCLAAGGDASRRNTRQRKVSTRLGVVDEASRQQVRLGSNSSALGSLC